MQYQYSVNYAFFNVKLQFYLSLLCNMLCNIVCEFTWLLLCNSEFVLYFPTLHPSLHTLTPLHPHYTSLTPPTASNIPDGHQCLEMHGLVEELVVNDDPEYQLTSLHYSPQYIPLYPHTHPLHPQYSK